MEQAAGAGAFDRFCHKQPETFYRSAVQGQPYEIIGYSQDELGATNNYQQLPIQHLLGLWQSLNRQIIYVIQNIPAEKLAYKVNPQYNQTGTQTLEWLICDYVAHMQHHLRAMALITELNILPLSRGCRNYHILWVPKTAI
jgi:hypothetical protein